MRGLPRLPTGLLLLALLWGGHALVNLRWVSQDRTLRANDMGPHLIATAAALGQVRRHGLIGAARVARGAWPLRWPGAAYLPWVPPGLLLGQSVQALRLYNLGLLALLMGLLYGAGLTLGSRRAGLWAAALVCLYPAIYGEARQFEMDLPGAVLSALCFLCLLRTHGFTRWAPSLALGLCLGLTLLVRPPALLLLFAPLAGALALGLLRPAPAGGHRGRALVLARALCCGVAAAAVSAVWWAGRAQEIAGNLALHQQGFGFAGQGSSWRFYAGALPLATSPLLAALAGLALVSALASLRRDVHGPAPARRLLLLALWLAGGGAALCFMQVHMLRYLLPLLPALALLSGWGLSRLPRTRAVAVALCALLLLALGAWLVESLDPRGWPPRPAPTRMVDLPRHEPYLTSGPPIINPQYAALERAVERLQSRHPNGQPLLIQLVNQDHHDPLRINWMAPALLLTGLPGASLTARPLEVYVGDPAVEEPLFSTSVIPPAAEMPPRYCYGLRAINGHQPKPLPPGAKAVLLNETYVDRMDPTGWSRLTLYTIPGCAIGLTQ